MTDQQFQREANYRAAISVAKEMLTAGIISDDDFSKIKAFFIEKFQPVFAGIC